MHAPKIKIQNVVAAFSFNHELDLEKIRKAFAEECFFETLTDKRFTFRVVALRIEDPKMSLLIYRTGKVVCTGAKTVKDAEHSAEYFLDRLRKAGFDSQTKAKAKIQNIVATADLKTSIDLERFLSHIQEEKQFHFIYEPEQFPGAIVKFPVAQGSEATVLLFSSGKLVCAGLTRYKHIQKAVELFTSRLMVEPT